MKTLLIILLFLGSYSVCHSQDTLQFKDGRVIAVHLVSVTTEHTFFTLPTDTLTVTRISNDGLEKIVLAPESNINISAFQDDSSAKDSKAALNRKVLTWTLVFMGLFTLTLLIIEGVNDIGT